MPHSSVIFSFRDRIILVIATFVSKALRDEIDYSKCCAIPKLSEFLGVTPSQMNSELQTLVTRGYLTIHNEIAFPTLKALKRHPTFKGLPIDDALALFTRLKSASPRS